MANPYWPGALPQAALLGHTESPPDTTLRTQMDAGPAKTRPRFTAGVRPIQIPMIMTDDQVTTLETFYTTTLAGGALKFDFRLPRTGAVVTYRFTGPPQWTLVESKRWRVTLPLEVLP